MDIVGLSEKTLEKFIEKGFIKQLADLYRLDTFERDIAAMDGFGQKSYDNIWKSIQRSRKTTFVPFIHALGIPMVGKGQAKLFDKAYKGDVRKFFNDVYNRKCFTGIDGIGEKIELSLWDWGSKYLGWIPYLLDEMWRISYNTEVYDLLRWIDVEVPAETDAPAGKIFFPARHLLSPARSITSRTVQNCRRKLKNWVAKQLGCNRKDQLSD